MDELFKDMELKGLVKYSVIASNTLRNIYDYSLKLEDVSLLVLENSLPNDFELSDITNINYLKNVGIERKN